LAKPAVDGIERDSNGARIMRFDVMSSEGREIAARYAVRGLPTLVVFDGTGEAVLQQVGRIDKDSVLSTLSHIQQ